MSLFYVYHYLSPAVTTKEKLKPLKKQEIKNPKRFLQQQRQLKTITSMKLHSDGMAEFAYGKDPWLYKNGFFAMKSLDYVKWAFKKIDDQTFTLFVEPTQKTFTYKFVKNL